MANKIKNFFKKLFSYEEKESVEKNPQEKLMQNMLCLKDAIVLKKETQELFSKAEEDPENEKEYLKKVIDIHDTYVENFANGTYDLNDDTKEILDTVINQYTRIVSLISENSEDPSIVNDRMQLEFDHKILSINTYKFKNQQVIEKYLKRNGKIAQVKDIKKLELHIKLDYTEADFDELSLSLAACNIINEEMLEKFIEGAKETATRFEGKKPEEMDEDEIENTKRFFKLLIKSFEKALQLKKNI